MYIYIYAIHVYIYIYIYIYNCVTVVLNYAVVKKDPKLITKIKPFVKKYNLKGINFELEKYDWKNLKKIMQKLLLLFCMPKKKKYVLCFKT